MDDITLLTMIMVDLLITLVYLFISEDSTWHTSFMVILIWLDVVVFVK